MNCKTCGAEYSDNPKSKYCKPCRAKARAAWRAMIAESAEKREKRDAFHAEVYRRAADAAVSAMESTVPVPMLVVEHANPADDNSPPVKAWESKGGVCGFAWVNIRPGNCSFALWLAKHKGARRGYFGGMQFWISGGGQSYEKKMAGAEAFADVCRAAGIAAHAEGRLD